MVGRGILSLVSVCALACLSAATQALAAQDRIPIDLAPDEAAKDPAPEPNNGRHVIDVLAPPPEEVARNTEACEAEQDYARIRGEIVVCRELGNDEHLSGFDREDWERRYAEQSQGTKPPDVAGAGGTIIMPTEGSLATITVTIKGCYIGPCAPEEPVIVGFAAMPEAPEGSDADRIANGLPLAEE